MSRKNREIRHSDRQAMKQSIERYISKHHPDDSYDRTGPIQADTSQLRRRYTNPIYINCNGQDDEED